MTRDEAVAALSGVARTDPHVRLAVDRLKLGGKPTAEVLVWVVLEMVKRNESMQVTIERSLGLDAEKWLGSEG